MALSNSPGDSSKTVGECTIFNHETYDKHMKLSQRKKSSCDVKRLEHVFKELDFNVQTHTNYSKAATEEALKTVSENISKDDKYFVCCILTHGDSTDRLATRDRYLDLEDIICNVKPSKNPDIPRIFIIQACRGEDIQKIRKMESTDFIYENEMHPGFIIARSTYPGKLAFKNGHGSYFIQELCNCFEYFSKDQDLFQILTVCSYRLANFFRTDSKEYSLSGQMPHFVSTLKSPILFQKSIKHYESDDRKVFDERRANNRPNQSGEKNSYCDLKRFKIDSAKSVKFYQILIKKNGPTELEKAAAMLKVKMLEKYRTDTIRSDLKKSKIIEEIKSIANKASGNESSKIDCVIIFVASPCKGQYFCDKDGRKFSKTDVIENFVREQPSSFVGKPKVFIFLLCESKAKMESTDLFESTDGSDESQDSFFIAEHANILDITISIKNSDILEEVIKIFVTQLTEKETSEMRSEDLMTTLTRINSELCEKFDFNPKSKKPTNNFSFSSTLTKKLILP